MKYDLTLKISMTTIDVFAASVNQDQTAYNVQSDLDLHCLLRLHITELSIHENCQYLSCSS